MVAMKTKCIMSQVSINRPRRISGTTIWHPIYTPFSKTLMSFYYCTLHKVTTTKLRPASLKSVPYSVGAGHTKMDCAAGNLPVHGITRSTYCTVSDAPT